MLQLSLSSLAATLLTLNTALAFPGGNNAVAHGPSYEPQCSPRVIALATGIQLNIVAQHGKLRYALHCPCPACLPHSQNTPKPFIAAINHDNSRLRPPPSMFRQRKGKKLTRTSSSIEYRRAQPDRSFDRVRVERDPQQDRRLRRYRRPHR